MGQVLFDGSQLGESDEPALLQQLPRVALEVVEGPVRGLADLEGAGIALLLGAAGHLIRMREKSSADCKD